MRILLAAAVLIAGCGGGPTEPRGEPLTGTWTASRVGDWQGVTINVVEQSPSEIRGTWTGRIGGGLRYGEITEGSRDGESFTLTLDGAGMPCGYGTLVEATRNGGTASGTAWTLHCDGNRSVWSNPVTLSR